jgi:hypothetical protein
VRFAFVPLLLAAPAQAEKHGYFEPELGGELIDFVHDCPGPVENGFCSKAGAYSGATAGLGGRGELTDGAGIAIRARFGLVSAGYQYYLGVGFYRQFIPSTYAEITAGFGTAAQPDDRTIETKGYMASLRVARELAPWLSLAVQASTFVYRTSDDSQYPMRSYEASVVFVLPLRLD